MPMFGFDEQYAYFDVTPVDNQFILEYLPGATGDAVRVYLYGLMQCYHHQEGMTLEQMARELHMSPEEVQAAYRHWERKGLVRRVADHPPTYKYVSVKYVASSGGSLFQVDDEYAAFCEELQSIFGDRRIHGGEQARCYEWVEDPSLGLDARTVLHIIRRMVEKNGVRTAVKTIESRVMELAAEGVSTPEDVDELLDRDKAIEDGTRAVLRRFGRRRNPTQDEMNMYRVWQTDWGFTQEDILAACAETTKGEPTFAYLNGILTRLNQKRSGRVADMLAGEKEQTAPLKALLSAMNLRDVSINETTLAAYEDMRTLYPDAIILMAGQECAKRGAGFDDVMQTLKAWKREGLETIADVRAYMQRVDSMNDVLRMVYHALGVATRPNAPDRRLVTRWLEDYGYDAAFITQCAEFALGKEKPMAYLAALLDAFHKKGVRTMEDARREREQFVSQQSSVPTAPRTGKVVGEQLYTQRTYTHTEDAMDALMKQWQEENGDA